MLNINPVESVFWHFKTYDLSKEQLTRLKNLDCRYINIGDVVDNTYYNTVIKFNRSVRKGGARNKLVYNINTNWKLISKELTMSVNIFLLNVINNNSQFIKGILPTVIKKNENAATINDLYKLRIKKAKNKDWDWFTEFDCKWYLSQEFERLYNRYNRYN